MTHASCFRGVTDRRNFRHSSAQKLMMNVEMHDIHERCETFKSTQGFRRHEAQYLRPVAQYAYFNFAEQQAGTGEAAPRAISNPWLESTANQGLPRCRRHQCFQEGGGKSASRQRRQSPAFAASACRAGCLAGGCEGQGQPMQARHRESRVTCPSCRTANSSVDGIGEIKRQQALRSKSRSTLRRSESSTILSHSDFCGNVPAMPSAHDAPGPSWPEVHCGVPKVRRS